MRYNISRLVVMLQLMTSGLTGCPVLVLRDKISMVSNAWLGRKPKGEPSQAT
jgi:hypothetical protein